GQVQEMSDAQQCPMASAAPTGQSFFTLTNIALLGYAKSQNVLSGWFLTLELSAHPFLLERPPRFS
ncbi:MAG: hypothetical protein R3194_14660, partial [Limnobacter sp.]|nr:hypothetical protein [Limnobacter sp.]